MYEEIIGQLDAIGVAYNEDVEAGSLTVDVAAMDKVQLIEVINIMNGAGLPFDINETTLTVSGFEMEPMEEPEPEEPAEGVDAQQMALDEMF